MALLAHVVTGIQVRSPSCGRGGWVPMTAQVHISLPSGDRYLSCLSALVVFCRKGQILDEAFSRSRGGPALLAHPVSRSWKITVMQNIGALGASAIAVVIYSRISNVLLARLYCLRSLDTSTGGGWLCLLDRPMSRPTMSTARGQGLEVL